MAHILDRQETRFPNPCPVCDATDEHAAWRSTVTGSPCTYCPHPAERGHGTGCCCAGWSEEGLRRSMRELVKPRPLTPDEIRQLLRECVTVVKPGEVLVIRVHENTTPAQLREQQDMTDAWIAEHAPGMRVMLTRATGFAVAEGGTDEPCIA